MVARGYVDCAAELLAQVPDLRHVIVAAGSSGTMAGLVAGLAGLGAGHAIGPGQVTVFLHTGGLPGLLAHPELATTPA
jgi:1-aminocyclopropane-1-carboxylate deaminase/D-cysteine desulfhydrase-like pyridoxal-dependent ACC family enzyme